MLNADQVYLMVFAEIGTSRRETTVHGVDLREVLVRSSPIEAIGVQDEVVDAGRVLIADAESGEGDRIVVRGDGSTFRPAVVGAARAAPMAVRDWTADSNSAFRGMSWSASGVNQRRTGCATHGAVTRRSGVSRDNGWPSVLAPIRQPVLTQPVKAWLLCRHRF